jgi:tetratricopeptide (TPR) repeat protein
MAPLLALLLFVAAGADGLDVLCLKDGRVIQSRSMHRTAAGVDVDYAHGTVRVPKAMILDAVLAEDAHVSPATDEEKDQVAKGFVRFEGKWVTTQERDRMLAKRVEQHRKAIDEMKAHGEWRNRQIQDTKTFRFEYTLPQNIFEPYRNAMEAYFDEFARMWQVKPPKAEDRLPVCFYSDEASFHQIGGAPKGVLGYFRYVRPWDLNIYYERLDPSLSQEVMFHEANHYLQQLINVKFAVPHFPGESLAEYYGATTWDPVKKKLAIGAVNEGRLCEIQTDIAGGNYMDLLKLVTTPDMYEHYTWGWSLVHFLMSDARYTPKFQRFFFALPDAKGVQRQRIANGLYTIDQQDVWTVFTRELGLKDAAAVRKLEVEWHDYVDQKLKLVTRYGVEKAAFKAKETGRTLRATRLFNEAIDKGSQNALVFHNLAEIYAAGGKRDLAFDTWKKAIEIDPLEGVFYSRMAFYLDDTDKKEAGRLRKLAEEIGYDDPWTIIVPGDENPEPEKPVRPGDRPKGG